MPGRAAGGGARSAWRRPGVVGVLGEAHVQGVLELWEGGRWHDALEEAGLPPGGPALGQRWLM